MKKSELFKDYEEAKNSEKRIAEITIRLHMPDGEEEIIFNPNVEKKMEYIDKTYSDDLVHKNNPDIYIVDAFFLMEINDCMNFSKALELMKKGYKLKLPSWGGYWYWDAEKETIVMHTKDGDELDIRETQRVSYTLENILSVEWQVADEKNCPQLGGEVTFGFGEAIKYLKRGLKLTRKGWNGKRQYIELATAISYESPDEGVINCEHAAIGNKAIAFCGTSGIQIGWLASQADMLADDWTFA